MIGTDLNLDLPLSGDTMAVFRAKTTTALSAIEDSIADKATPAGLDITSNLSFVGNHATNVGGVILVDGNNPTSAGSLYYSGGAFYARDATGIIQLTASGAINVAGIGAIGGDYGGSNPAIVYFDDASGEYRFYEDTTGPVWADLVADDLVLMETGGTDYIRLSAPASLTSTYTLTLADGLPTNKAVVMVDSAGAVTYEESPALATNNSFVVSGTGDYKHGDQVISWFPPFIVRDSGPELKTPDPWGTESVRIQIAGSGGVHRIPGPPLRVGWRLKSVTYEFNSGTNPAADALMINRYDTGYSKAITVSGSAPFRTYTLDTAYTVVAGDQLWLKVTPGSQAIDFSYFNLTYDIP